MDLNAHTLSFYVNGELTKTWDASGKPGLAGSQKSAYLPASGEKLPFLIGCATTYAEASTWDLGYITYRTFRGVGIILPVLWMS